MPQAGGPISAAVLQTLNHGRLGEGPADLDSVVARSDPYGLDMQLALYLCYELHYRGFAGVDPRWEWDPGLLHLRRQLEDRFLADVRRDLGRITEDDTAFGEMAALSVEPAEVTGPSRFLQTEGGWGHMREYFVHRSLYHLKEGDPHAWTIPRLTGQAKASFVAVEFDEYGGGRAARLHQQLFADLLEAAELDPTYLGYVDWVPAVSLAPVNLMSMFGLHRALRGASAGHFAATEITSSPGSYRLAEGLRRLGAPRACIGFYAEHVEADAVHEQVVRTDVIADLVAREPLLEPDVVFGMRAFGFVEDRLADHLMRCWMSGRSSLRKPLAEVGRHYDNRAG